MYEKEIQNSIKNELDLLATKEITLYESALFSENRQAIKTAVFERTKRQLSIVMSNYQQALEQLLFSDVVSDETYKNIAFEIDDVVSDVARDIKKDKESTEELMEYFSGFNPTDSSIVSSVTDTMVLDAIGYAMTEIQIAFNERFEDLHEHFMNFNTDYEANMDSLDKSTDLATPDLYL
ncbi:hypothetical protein [Enterococcus faecalis]|uniref:hypothetical protein n=1 Tax=Enterococcus faecalis TaxID=1351 RepID=UPI002938AD5E|nr:hypothetical protein [Enterococcus faecalis]